MSDEGTQQHMLICIFLHTHMLNLDLVFDPSGFMILLFSFRSVLLPVLLQLVIMMILISKHKEPKT